MRTSTLARAGAAITASALAFSLGAGPVSAAETSTATAPAAAAAATPSDGFSTSNVGAAGVPTSAINFRSGVITNAPTTRFFGTGTFAPEDATTAVVAVKGRVRGTVPVLFSNTPGDNAIAVDVPSAWGSGKVQINVAGAASNVFYARKHVTSDKKYPLKIRRVNNKVTFRAYHVKILNPGNGKYVSVKRVKLQQLKKGTWKTKKTIKLNRRGDGSYKTSIKTKYRYRLYIPRSATQERFMTLKTGKI
jgi:hypothetical protein